MINRSASRYRLLLALLVSVLAGCEFAPPPPPNAPSLRSSSTPYVGATSAPKTPEVVFVLPAKLNSDLKVLGQVVRYEVGNLRALYREVRPKPEDPPTKQAELIRSLLAGKPAALIIAPESTKETIEAINEAESKKIPTVVLGFSPVAELPQGSVFVGPGSHDPAAKALVEVAVASAKERGLDPKGPAIILANKDFGDSGAPRRIAFEKAAKEAGIRVLEVEGFDATPSEAEKTIRNALAKEPKLSIILADDDLGLAGAASITRDDEKPVKVSVVGYIVEKYNTSLLSSGHCDAVVNRNLDQMGRQAVRIALARAKGEKAPARVEIELSILKATGAEVRLEKPETGVNQ